MDHCTLLTPTLRPTQVVCQVRAASQCLGIGNASTDKLCAGLKKRDACIKTAAFDSVNITASCIWHSVQTKRVKDEQTLRSKSGLPIGVTGLDYRGSLCGISAKVTVPKQARSKWGAFAALRGGPDAGTVLQGSTNPNIMMSTSACQISKGTLCILDFIADLRRSTVDGR